MSAQRVAYLLLAGTAVACAIAVLDDRRHRRRAARHPSSQPLDETTEAFDEDAAWTARSQGLLRLDAALEAAQPEHPTVTEARHYWDTWPQEQARIEAEVAEERNREWWEGERA